jgi:hypothetical protein
MSFLYYDKEKKAKNLLFAVNLLNHPLFFKKEGLEGKGEHWFPSKKSQGRISKWTKINVQN